MYILPPEQSPGNPDRPQLPVPATTADTAQLDWREQLFNEGLRGPINIVQLSRDRITKLNGILFDIDPKLFGTSAIIPYVPMDPAKFYAVVLKPWLSRHPVLAKAEVRCSGTGLHVILWFANPPEFDADAERQRWAIVVEVVQAALPVDPNQPGITGVTRPIGSINSRNNVPVTRLAAGVPVPREEVIELYDQMRAAPFRTVAQIVFGMDRIAPCPKCNQHGSHMSALKWSGQCYGPCGKVSLDDLYDILLAVADAETMKGGEHGAE